MLESFKGNALEYQKLTEEEQQQRGILGRLVGVIADSNNPTRNGRKYGKTLWENVFNDPIVQEKIKNRCFFSELDHPVDRDETCSEKIAGCLAEQPKFNDKGQLCGVFDILNTPNGRILKALCDYGTTIGVSSRGNGDVFINDDGEEEVDESTYDCQAFDFVIVPAVETARLNYVTESLQQDNQKLLRKALRESLSHESDDNKKIMKETLKNLGIKLIEPKKKLKENVSKSEFSDLLFDTILKNDNFQQLDIDKFNDDVDKPNEVDKKNGIIRLNYDNKYFEIKINEIDEVNEDVNIQKNDDIDSSKKEEVKDNVLEVKDNESNELLKQLQEALKSKVDTDKQLQSLQEQLAVSDTKVKKLEEELGRYKQSTINLSNQVRESKNLNKDIESLKEQVETKDKMIKVLSEKVSNLNESVKKANEGRQFLIEKINNDKSNATKLKETLESNHNKEVSSLNEKLNKVTKDYEVKLQESNSKLAKATKLVERYKNFVEATVDKYIESKAIMLGITPNEIKNRLNESYTLDDVDRICDDLQDYNLRISKLPFSVSKGTKISISESKKPTPKPIDDENDLSGLNEIMSRL